MYSVYNLRHCVKQSSFTIDILKYHTPKLRETLKTYQLSIITLHHMHVTLVQLGRKKLAASGFQLLEPA